MNTFITLISSQDYLPAALVLNHSLKRVQSKYPLVVALTKNLATEENLTIFQQENIKVEIINCLKYSDNIKQLVNEKWKYKSSVLNTASKIDIFSLKHYEKIIYLDVDTLVLENIDDLFDKYDGSILWWNEPMSGLFVIEPKNHDSLIYQNLLPMALDGSIIAAVFFVSKSNPEYRISDKYMKNTMFLNETKIIHYDLAKKPFLMTAIEAKEAVKKWPAYALYFYYLIPFKQKYNL